MKKIMFGLVLVLFAGQSHAWQEKKVPKVLLMGDSIRMAYAPVVEKMLVGRVEIISQKANGGDSANVLKNLDAWVLQHQPDLVHINCGLHDLKFDKKTMRYQVSLEEYESNLRNIVIQIREKTKARIVFALTTPIIDERHAQRKATFDRFEKDVLAFNAVALKVMDTLKVPVNDLHEIVVRGNAGKMLGKDGTHYTPEGNQKLAQAVTDTVKRHLVLMEAKPWSPPKADPEKTKTYQKEEKSRDEQVPQSFRNLKVPAFQQPVSANAWDKERKAIHQKVVDTLGYLPERAKTPHSEVLSIELNPNYRLESIRIDNPELPGITAYLILPRQLKQALPCVMWLHSSSYDRNHVITANSNGGEISLAEVLVSKGYAVFAPDAIWYGERGEKGPNGLLELGRTAQESLTKFHLWMGRTLWGIFVHDDQVALDYLVSRPEVDKKRIAATGMSMGSTRAWWLAAVDERISSVIAVACMTRYQNLIRHGQLKAHGIYYFSYGLLRHFDTEAVLALIAPRPLLILTGDLDHGSPMDGIQVLDKELSKIYGTLGAKSNFRNVIYPDTGHVYTPEMRSELLEWLSKTLK